MAEQWVPVKGFESLYEISDLGRLRSIRRCIDCSNGPRIYESKFIRPNRLPNGYLQVRLRVNGNLYTRYLHRLVAEAFLPNTEGLPEVNHKDEDKTNCRSDNLEWSTRKYNVNYGTGKWKAIVNRVDRGREPVYSIDPTGKKTIWHSISEAGKTLGIPVGNISHCLIHTEHHKTAGGLKWFYLEEDEANESSGD